MTENTIDPAQPYELFMFARKHALTVSQTREILDRYGSDRAGADAAAKAFAERDLEDGINRSKKVHRPRAGLWEDALSAAATGTNASPGNYLAQAAPPRRWSMKAAGGRPSAGGFSF